MPLLYTLQWLPDPEAAILNPECTSAPNLKNKQHSQDPVSGAWTWTL